MANFKFTSILPPGSIITITGANGYIAGHVCDQALAAGYRVHGTVRSLDRAKWLQDLFDTKYGADMFTLIKVEDTSEAAFDKAASKGTDAFVHIAADVSITPEPEPYIGNVTASALNALKSAAKQPNIKRFVLTSSSMACAPWQPNVEYTLQPNDYNEKWLKEAYEGPFDLGNMWKVYAGSKVASEKAAWKWVAENRPSFEFNTTLPAADFGRTVSGEWASGIGGWPKLAVEGDFSLLQHVAPQYYVDVVDMAKLYLGAVLHPDVKGERVLGACEPYNWNQVIGIVKEAFPDMKVSNGLPDQGADLGKLVARERSEWLLGEMGQEAGWTSLNECLIGAFSER